MTQTAVMDNYAANVPITEHPVFHFLLYQLLIKDRVCSVLKNPTFYFVIFHVVRCDFSMLENDSALPNFGEYSWRLTFKTGILLEKAIRNGGEPFSEQCASRGAACLCWETQSSTLNQAN